MLYRLEIDVYKNIGVFEEDSYTFRLIPDHDDDRNVILIPFGADLHDYRRNRHLLALIGGQQPGLRNRQH